jgi:hypothetical protein
MSLKLFLIGRYGNNESPDGPDGTDTMFVVAAQSVAEAGALADAVLRDMPHDRVAAFSNVSYEIGVAGDGIDCSGVLLGPFLHMAIRPQSSLALYREVERRGWREWEQSCLD